MNIKLFIILIFSALNVSAEDKKCEIVAQEKWSNVFAGREFTLHFVISALRPFTGKVGWQYSFDGHTIARSERAVTVAAGRDETVDVQLQSPTVKEGVAIQTILTVSAFEQNNQKTVASLEKKIWVFPEDSFADRREWLKKLNILLFDPDGKTAALFTKAGIPFKETRNISALGEVKDGMIIVAEGISFKDYRGLPEAMVKSAASGTPVLCLGGACGEMQFPGMGETTLPQPASMMFKRNEIITALDKRLDTSSWYPDGRAVISSVMLKGERGPVSGEIVPNENGWPWVELTFGGKGRTLLICGFGIVKSWEVCPAPQFLLAKILEHISLERAVRQDEHD